MKYALCFLLALSSCTARAVEDESVVSVYTTQPSAVTGAGAPQLDIYRQIANNIAERITSPIYRFLGLRRNKTNDQPVSSSWEKIELFDEPEDVTKPIQTVDNDISKDRDTEELSVEALRKIDKKPEKITLFSSYLPVNNYVEGNDTINEIVDDEDESFGLDDVDLLTTDSTARDSGPLVYILETFGSLWQFFIGAVGAIFNMSSSNNNSNNDSGVDNSS